MSNYYVKISDRLEKGRQEYNKAATHFINLPDSSIPNIDGLIRARKPAPSSYPILEIQDGGNWYYLATARTKELITVDEIESNLITNSGLIITDELETRTIDNSEVITTQDLYVENLFVSGTINQVEEVQLFIEDQKIVLNSALTGDKSNSSEGDGYLKVNRGDNTDSYLRWDEINDLWKYHDGDKEYSIIGVFNDELNIDASKIEFKDNKYFRIHDGKIFYSPDGTIEKEVIGSKDGELLIYADTITFDNENELVSTEEKIFYKDNELIQDQNGQIIFEDASLNPGIRIEDEEIDNPNNRVYINYDKIEGKWHCTDLTREFYIGPPVIKFFGYEPYTYIVPNDGITEITVPLIVTEKITGELTYTIFLNGLYVSESVDFTFNENIITFNYELEENDIVKIYAGPISYFVDLGQNWLVFNEGVTGNPENDPSINAGLYVKRGDLLPAKLFWNEITDRFEVDNGVGFSVPITRTNIMQRSKTYEIGTNSFDLDISDIVSGPELQYINDLDIVVFRNGMLSNEDVDYTINNEEVELNFSDELLEGDIIKVFVGKLLLGSYSHRNVQKQYITIESDGVTEVVINRPFKNGEDEIRVYVNGLMNFFGRDYNEVGNTLVFNYELNTDDFICIFFVNSIEGIKYDKRLLEFDVEDLAEGTSERNAGIIVNRGTNDPIIIWNEEELTFQFSNDGTIFYNLGSDEGSAAAEAGGLIFAYQNFGGAL